MSEKPRKEEEIFYKKSQFRISQNIGWAIMPSTRIEPKIYVYKINCVLQNMTDEGERVKGDKSEISHLFISNFSTSH